MFADVEASSFDSSPLGSDPEVRFQQVFGSSLLGAINVGDQITGLTFRVEGGSPAVLAQTVANYEIRLSTSANAPSSLSTTFAEYRGADDVIARSGPLVFGSGDFPTGGNPNFFGVTIPFTTPFTYAGGPLLVEVAHDGSPLGGTFADADFPTMLDAQTVFAEAFSATVATFGPFPEAIVFQFQVTPIPEPSTLLLTVGPVGLLGRRWLRRQ